MQSSISSTGPKHTGELIPTAALNFQEFEWIRRMLYEQTGIVLGDHKKTLVTARLEKRLRHLGITSYSVYFKMLRAPEHATELRNAIDLLTTNETYFFREPTHFEFVEKRVLPALPPGRPARFWSAASSSGEEAYSIAMVVADRLPTGNWEILGTDISTRVLEAARQGVYSISAADKIPRRLLNKFCLRGMHEYEGSMLIQRTLRERVKFQHANLIGTLTQFGKFDAIFLRNVMIYFDTATKARLVAKMEAMLNPGGYFLVSHSESLNGIPTKLLQVQPAIYRLPTDN